MTNKKESKNWYIALTHFLTAGIFFPIAFTLPIIILLDQFFNIKSLPITLTIYFSVFPANVLGWWVGNIVAVKFINKKYLTKNTKPILKYSLIYLIIYSLLFIGTDVEINTVLRVIFGFIELFLYYIISKKYIAKIINFSPQA